jgi:hypothetical protein
MHSSLGARLREQRERQQVDLTAIAAQTKIKLGLLEALESDRVTTWPKGIFGRAYLRDYARAIGLDPEPLVREFYERYPDSITPVPAHPSPEEIEAADAPTPFRRLMNSMFGSLRQRSPRPDPAIAAVAAGSSGLASSEYDDVLEDMSMAHVSHAAPNGYHAIEMADDRASGLELTDDLTGSEPMSETVESPAEPEQSTHFVDLHEEPERPRLELAMDMPVRQEARRQEPSLQEFDLDAVERLTGVAHLCTRLAQVVDWRGVDAVLADATSLLDAAGLIVWSWDQHADVLTPSLAYGYSAATMSRLPPVRVDEGHALATSFRTMDVAIVDGSAGAHGALVVPLMAPRGCIGVLALELRHRAERNDTVRAVATILAAQLVTLMDQASAAAVSA